MESLGIYFYLYNNFLKFELYECINIILAWEDYRYVAKYITPPQQI